jgi:hypothetical protein
MPQDAPLELEIEMSPMRRRRMVRRARPLQ